MLRLYCTCWVYRAVPRLKVRAIVFVWAPRDGRLLAWSVVVMNELIWLKCSRRTQGVPRGRLGCHAFDRVGGSFVDGCIRLGRSVLPENGYFKSLFFWREGCTMVHALPKTPVLLFIARKMRFMYRSSSYER